MTSCHIEVVCDNGDNGDIITEYTDYTEYTVHTQLAEIVETNETNEDSSLGREPTNELADNGTVGQSASDPQTVHLGVRDEYPDLVNCSSDDERNKTAQMNSADAQVPHESCCVVNNMPDLPNVAQNKSHHSLAAQIKAAADKNHDGTLSAGEIAAYVYAGYKLTKFKNRHEAAELIKGALVVMALDLPEPRKSIALDLINTLTDPILDVIYKAKRSLWRKMWRKMLQKIKGKVAQCRGVA